LAEEVAVRRVQVGEVAAPAAGDADLLPHLAVVLEEQHAAALPAVAARHVGAPAPITATSRLAEYRLQQGSLS
jgi:hypothetical protein